ncbi:MAG: hypothetical protein MJE77_14755 [Proteobacteria bacterium]|nr:hypothetical protein [Pseudomonadota bacterium]
MDWFAHAIGRAVDLILSLFDGIPTPWNLVVVSIATGALILWIIGLTTRPARVTSARSQMASAIYEIRLFLDSPRRVIAAQGRFLAWSSVYIGALLPGLLVASIPLALFYTHLDRRYGVAPISTGQPVLVRVDLDRDAESFSANVDDAHHAHTAAVRVVAPPLTVEDERRVYVRIEVTEPGIHELTLQIGAERISKLISADSDALAVLPERSRGIEAMWANGGDEPPLSTTSTAERIVVAHPVPAQNWLGVSMPWWLAWLIIATVAALLLRGPMRVSI